MLAVKQASDDLLAFSKLMMPDPDRHDDPVASAYEETPLARLLCQIVQKVQRRELKRVGISVGPQFGKSTVISRNAPAWLVGKNPRLNVMLGTYNQPRADEEGDEVRARMSSPAYAQIFPNTTLRKGGAAKDLLITTDGGRMAFVGRGGSGTGKPADVFIIDDPIKDSIEANSEATREETWNWYTKVAGTRLRTNSAVIILHTRWHEDDLLGRLCDPTHPERNKRFKGIAQKWTYINIPAVIDDPKLAKALGLTLETPKNPDVISMFGCKPITSLWPKEKSLELLAESKMWDAAAFTALYMGAPSPDDGDYFKSDWLVEYEREELPDLDKLSIYGASDHAVKTKQSRDSNVIGCVGVDEHDNIWVLPDLVWDRMDADRIVEELLSKFNTPGLNYWFMESEHISKTFGPFLLKRMHETRTYTPIDEITVSQDLMARARSIQGRMAMKKVRFPSFAPWWPNARQQILKFPNATNDDVVSFLSLVGQGLHKQRVPEDQETPADESNVIRVGSMKWILAEAKRKLDEGERQVEAARGW